MLETDAVLEQELHPAFEHRLFLAAREPLLFGESRQCKGWFRDRAQFERRHSARVVARRDDERPGITLDLLHLEYEHRLTGRNVRAGDQALRGQLLRHRLDTPAFFVGGWLVAQGPVEVGEVQNNLLARAPSLQLAADALEKLRSAGFCKVLPVNRRRRFPAPTAGPV